MERAIQKAKREAMLATKEPKEEREKMSNPPCQTLGDYCRRTNAGHHNITSSLSQSMCFSGTEHQCVFQ